MSDPTILRLTGERRVRDIHVLAEYDAIILDPRFAPLFGYSDTLVPGTRTYADHAPTVIDAAAELEKRSKELQAFFELGGILIVYAYAETVLVHRHVRMYSDTTETVASTHSWLVQRLTPPPRLLRPGERIPFPSSESTEPWLRAGRGAQTRVVEPGHTFGTYLEAATTYEARFAGYVRDWSNAVVLAENRAGEPVAVEFAAVRGSAVVVPPPKDSAQRELLIQAVLQLHRERVGTSRVWRLAEETRLYTEEREIAARQREEREALGGQRREIEATKGKALAQTHVKRAIAYWDRITAVGVTHERALQDLYKLIEMLEDLYGGERGLPTALGVERSKLKAVKRLANQEEFDVRHANADETEQLPLPSFNDAIEFGRELVQAFLERRAREVKVARQP